ncbi:MAG: hypothetical protein E7351_00030 [Clostridiales bacterium]|nr:hypothetical protein [Clostridiales bacterium]
MNTVSTGDFIKQVAEATGCTQVQVKAILNAAGEQIKANLKAGQEMHFIGYFNVGIKAKKAQTKLNPFTGEKIKVAACKVPTIKLSASFKQLLKKK